MLKADSHQVLQSLRENMCCSRCKTSACVMYVLYVPFQHPKQTCVHEYVILRHRLTKTSKSVFPLQLCIATCFLVMVDLLIDVLIESKMKYSFLLKY